MKTELEIESELIVNVEGDYTPKTKSYFDHNLGNWLPGESAGIENFKVFIVNTNKKVEITDVISEKELDKLKNEFLEYCIWED